MNFKQKFIVFQLHSSLKKSLSKFSAEFHYFSVTLYFSRFTYLKQLDVIVVFGINILSWQKKNSRSSSASNSIFATNLPTTDITIYMLHDLYYRYRRRCDIWQIWSSHFKTFTSWPRFTFMLSVPRGYAMLSWKSTTYCYYYYKNNWYDYDESENQEGNHDTGIS